jgi:hypothetical protein
MNNGISVIGVDDPQIPSPAKRIFLTLSITIFLEDVIVVLIA